MIYEKLMFWSFKQESQAMGVACLTWQMTKQGEYLQPLHCCVKSYSSSALEVVWGFFIPQYTACLFGRKKRRGWGRPSAGSHSSGGCGRSSTSAGWAPVTWSPTATTRRTRGMMPSAWQLSKTDTKVASEVIINLNSMSLRPVWFRRGNCSGEPW